MSTETTPVEKKVENAGAQPKEEVTSTQTTSEVDYEAEATRLDVELKKTREERENYRRGLLKAKGKLPDEEIDTPPEDWREEARRIAREEYLSTKEADIQSQKDALVAASMKKVKELTLALKNRGQITTASGQGSNEDKPEVKVEKTLSKEQIADLKNRGWSDEKIETLKKNMAKGVQMSN